LCLRKRSVENFSAAFDNKVIRMLLLRIMVVKAASFRPWRFGQANKAVLVFAAFVFRLAQESFSVVVVAANTRTHFS
jgi:hypothetical protein